MRQQHRQVGGRLRKLSPMFAPCELRRLVTDMLREAGEAAGDPGMALGTLRTKGARFPDRRTMMTTRTKLRETFGKLRAQGAARTVGAGKATRRALVEG